ncbi:MAG TPA: hypothetical protein VFQ77_21985 [Pseudonocardiaceae bacterium]|jgi:hypothetical protein|nr:hypothetical protein [Pseudonocardiaceae bacterium]
MPQLSTTDDSAPLPFYQREVAAWITALITAGATVVSAIVTVALTTSSQHNEGSAGTSPGSPRVTIEQPERDVARNFTGYRVPMSGTSSGIRPGEVLWVFVERAGSGVLFPQQVPCGPDDDTGNWNCTVYVGQPVDSGIYVVHMVVANSMAQATIIDHWVNCQKRDCSSAGLNLPSGASDLTQLEVHRRS